MKRKTEVVQFDSRKTGHLEVIRVRRVCESISYSLYAGKSVQKVTERVRRAGNDVSYSYIVRK